VKCHIYTRTTGAMKNAFGGLLNTRRHYTHSWIHETLVDLLAIQKEIHAGVFAMMDGTTAGNGPGPRTMYPVVKNVILASADQVAIDAVAAKMMGFGNNGASLVGNLAWFGPLRGMQKLFFRTPLVHAFIFGSEAYHDYYRWAFKDGRVFRKWRDETSWGRLFRDYERRREGVAA
jgi:hypothetical protein